MGKIFAFFLGLYVIGQIISAIIDGNTAIAATHLTASLSDDETSIVTVASTTGFVSEDHVLQINEELILYTSLTATTFVGPLTRGAFGTEPKPHRSGARVYNETTGVINEATGFQVGETLSTSGPFRVIFALPGFFFKAIGRIVAWDYSFFQGEVYGFPLIYFRIAGQVASSLLIIAFVVALVYVAQGILRRP